MADGYRFDILEKRAERKAHLDDIGVATLPDQPGKRGYSAAESKMHFKAPVDYLFSLLCGCMEEVGSEFDGYAPLSGADFTGDVTIGGSLSVSGGIACDGSSVLFEKDISELMATVAKHEDSLYAYISHSDEEGALVATEIIKGVSPDKGDDGDTLATTEWTNGAIAEEASVREAKDDDLEASIEALRKDFDDLKSVVYGIHSLTYNSYEFPYLTSSIIPDEVDGRKTVGGSYAIADWVGGNSLRWTTNILGSNGPAEYVIEGGANGKNIYLVNSSGTWRESSVFSGDMNAKSDHKYLAIVRYDETVAPASGSLSPLLGFWNGDNSYTRANLLYSDGRYRYGVFTPDKDYLGCACVFQRFDANKAECTISDFRAAIWDLTANGDGSLTEAQAFAKYKGYFDADTASGYSESIKSTIVSKIESWGYNLFDGELEIGAIDRATGQDIANANSLRSKNYIPVVAGKTYTLETNLSASQFTEGYILEYDKDKNYIGYQVFNRPVSGTVNQKTLSNDTRFVRLRYYGTTNLGGVIPANETCFHRTGSRTGYAPYVGKLGEINIPNAPLKLDGVNGIHNLVTFEEQTDGSYNAILTGKIGIVDLGELNWSYWNGRFNTTQSLSDIVGSINNNTKANAICSRYEIVTPNQSVDSSKDKTIAIYSNGYIYARDSAYTDATTFKTAMSGVYLLFERAIPTTEVIATGLTFEQVSFLTEKGGSIVAIYEEVPPTASVDFMTKGE